MAKNDAMILAGLVLPAGGGGGGGDAATKAQVEKNRLAIEKLNGTGDGSVKKQVADAVSDVVSDAPDDLNTLGKIAYYIESARTDSAQMSNRITNNETSIANINSNLTQVNDNVAAIDAKADANTAALATKADKSELDDYAKKSDIVPYDDTELRNQISGKQDKLIEGNNVTLLDNGDGTTTISADDGTNVDAITNTRLEELTRL